MVAKQTVCIICGAKILSYTHPKKRCPTCDDLERIRRSTENSAKRRKRKKTMSNVLDKNIVITTTNGKDHSHEKQIVQEAPD